MSTIPQSCGKSRILTSFPHSRIFARTSHIFGWISRGKNYLKSWHFSVPGRHFFTYFWAHIIIFSSIQSKLLAEAANVKLITISIQPQLLYEQLRHMDIRHFVILECRHLANGCVLKCGCIGLMLFRNLSCRHNNMLYKYYRNCSGICMQRLWRFGCKSCNHWLTSMRQNGCPTLNGRLT